MAGKGKKKKSGKKGKKGKKGGGKAKEPQMTAQEAILAYQINVVEKKLLKNQMRILSMMVVRITTTITLRRKILMTT